MVKKVIVADASPLIAFGRIERLSLLAEIFGLILIPEVVAKECLADLSRPGAVAIQKAIAKKIIKIETNIDITKTFSLSDILGAGETAAIALALELNLGLLMDEKLGRQAAKKLNLSVIGTAGVLLLAKQRGLINQVSPLINELKQAGYYLSDELIDKVLKMASEF